MSRILTPAGQWAGYALPGQRSWSVRDGGVKLEKVSEIKIEGHKGAESSGECGLKHAGCSRGMSTPGTGRDADFGARPPLPLPSPPTRPAQECYPKSKGLFDNPSFRMRLLDLCSELTLGIRPSLSLGGHWVLKFDK